MSVGNAKVFLLLNRLPELDGLAQGLAEFCLGCGLSEELGGDLQLVVEEAVSNSIRHGYSDETPHEILVRVAFQDGELSVEIEDDARPFNPLEAPLPDLSLPVEERPIGGLGITLMRSLMDRAEYRRSGGKNLLRLVKRV